MKKFKFLASTLLLTFSMSSVALADANITVLINSLKLKTDVAPQIVNDRTMVPLRAIAENMGAEVIWNNNSRIVTINSKQSTIILTFNSNTALVNDREVKLDQPVTIMKDRTMVPLRFISENLGANVKWNNNTRTVVIEKNNSTEAVKKSPYTYSDSEHVITDMDEFIKHYGEPLSVKKGYDDHLDGETYDMKYNFGTAHFIPYYESDGCDLAYVSSNIDLVGTPRGIKIGDSVESVINKFCNDGTYEYYDGGRTDEDTRLLYKLDGEDLSSIGTISYNTSGEVSRVRYLNDFESGGASGIILKFKDNKLSNIEILYGYI